MNKLTKQEKAWIMYDIGNSAFVLMISTIIPIYFKNLAAAAGMSSSNSTAYLSYGISISTIIVAILGPILGTLADTKDYKKRLFIASAGIGIIGCACLAIPFGWMLFLIIFIIAKVGFSGSLIFYDSMLGDITTEDRMDHVSSLGYAWGYIGSCIPFTICLVAILSADKIGVSSTTMTLCSFILIALWWTVISMPLLRNYKQIHYVEVEQHPVKDSFVRLSKIFAELKNNKDILWFVLAFFFYIDGVYTIIDMATSYGKDVGISDNNLLMALLLTQVVAFPCSILFGRLSKKFKAEKLISVCILGYFGIALFALQLDRAWEFWFLAVCVAVFQGAIQALSRSYFAKIIPKEKSSEYFGIYDIFGKGAAFLGTLLMGISTQIFGTSKAGVAVISLMFVVGYILFKKAIYEKKKVSMIE
jgi:UMF1 family MFS transporter